MHESARYHKEMLARYNEAQTIVGEGLGSVLQAVVVDGQSQVGQKIRSTLKGIAADLRECNVVDPDSREVDSIINIIYSFNSCVEEAIAKTNQSFGDESELVRALKEDLKQTGLSEQGDIAAVVMVDEWVVSMVVGGASEPDAVATVVVTREDGEYRVTDKKVAFVFAVTDNQGSEWRATASDGSLLWRRGDGLGVWAEGQSLKISRPVQLNFPRQTVTGTEEWTFVAAGEGNKGESRLVERSFVQTVGDQEALTVYLTRHGIVSKSKIDVSPVNQAARHTWRPASAGPYEPWENAAAELTTGPLLKESANLVDVFLEQPPVLDDQVAIMRLPGLMDYTLMQAGPELIAKLRERQPARFNTIERRFTLPEDAPAWGQVTLILLRDPDGKEVQAGLFMGDDGQVVDCRIFEYSSQYPYRN